jgi:ribosomal protein S19
MVKNKKSPYVSPILYNSVLALPRRLRNYHIKHKGVRYKYKVHPVNVKTNSRSTCILPFCIGFSFIVTNGRIFIHVYVSESIIGHKFGEFCGTRRRYYYRNKRRKNKKRR